MRLGTSTWIGLAVVVMGLGLVWLAIDQQESSIRYVGDVQAAPHAHLEGSYTLLGIPHAATVPVAAAGGEPGQVANEDFEQVTKNVVPWADGQRSYHSTHTLHVEVHDHGSTWTFHNETRVAGDAQNADVTDTATWTLPPGHVVVRIQGFDRGAGEPPAMWGVYAGALPEGVQPKPSQFEGRLAATLPDGSPLPDGALVYLIDTYTAGCSSKFLPPEAPAKYEA